MTLKHRLTDYILQENTISDFTSQNVTFNSMLIQLFLTVSEMY